MRKPGAKVVPAVLIDQAVALLTKYPLHAIRDDPQGARTVPAPPDRAPDIILSESFSGPAHNHSLSAAPPLVIVTP